MKKSSVDVTIFNILAENTIYKFSDTCAQPFCKIEPYQVLTTLTGRLMMLTKFEAKKRSKLSWITSFSLYALAFSLYSFSWMMTRLDYHHLSNACNLQNLQRGMLPFFSLFFFSF